MSNHHDSGTLYVVATPIGNLGDISERAIGTLREVDYVAAEDTRHSKRLLDSLGINKPLLPYHDHNEDSQSKKLLGHLLSGSSIALISDAGTPLINDPGYRLVSKAKANDVVVVPVPGSCAAIAALSVSGLATDRFAYEGFPSNKRAARIRQFESIRSEKRTLVFYVSSHRVVETLADMVEVFGAEREATYARELTKKFETIRQANLGLLHDWVVEDDDQRKGEIVIVVAGDSGKSEISPLYDEVIAALADELPVKQAAQIASRITGVPKNDCYKSILETKNDR